MFEKHALHLALAAILLVACGSPAKGPGTSCDEISECAAGLDCVDPADTFATSNDAGCVGGIAHGLRICTASCAVDAECAAFGEGVVCAPNGCGPAGICLVQGDAQAAPGKP